MSINFPFRQRVQNMRRGDNLIKKSVSVLRCWFAILLFALLLVALYQPWGNCGELRPYELPSQKSTPYQQRYDAPAQRAPVEGFDYAAFGLKAAKLPPDERERLKQGLQQRLNRALAEKNYTEVSRYARLLEVVNNIK